MSTAEASLPDNARRAMPVRYGDHHGFLRSRADIAGLAHDTFLRILMKPARAASPSSMLIGSPRRAATTRQG